jgi:hypothetical protein
VDEVDEVEELEDVERVIFGVEPDVVAANATLPLANTAPATPAAMSHLSFFIAFSWVRAPA